MHVHKDTELGVHQFTHKKQAHSPRYYLARNEGGCSN